MKSETRNPKSESNLKLENTVNVAAVTFRDSNFEFVSDFEFRASDFVFPTLTPTHD
jgi:hypothetical protein